MARKEIMRKYDDDARRLQTFLRELGESELPQAKAAHLVCTYCDGDATCGACRLYQYLRTLQYHMIDGLPLKEAAKKAEAQAQNMLAKRNKVHDRRYGFGIIETEAM